MAPTSNPRCFYHAGASAKLSALICRLPWQPGRLAMCNGPPLAPFIPADWSTHTHTHLHLTQTHCFMSDTVKNNSSQSSAWQTMFWSREMITGRTCSVNILGVQFEAFYSVMRGKGCFHSFIQRQSVSKHVLTSCFCSQPTNMFHSVIQSQRFFKSTKQVPHCRRTLCICQELFLVADWSTSGVPVKIHSVLTAALRNNTEIGSGRFISNASWTTYIY